MLGRLSVQDAAASDRDYRRVESYDEPVAPPYGRRLLEPQLRVACLSGRDRVPVKKYHLAQHFVRSAVQVHPAVVEDHPVGRAEYADLGVYHVGDCDSVRICYHITPVYVFLGDAGQVYRRPLPRHGCVRVFSIGLYASDLSLSALRIYDHIVSDLHVAVHQGPRYDGAEALHREHPVHRQSEEFFLLAALVFPFAFGYDLGL